MMKKLSLAVLMLGLLLTPMMAVNASAAGAANTIAVCGCGMVFTPDENTKYITVDGKDYACCSDACHEKAAKNPEMAAKMAANSPTSLMFTKEAVGKGLDLTLEQGLRLEADLYFLLHSAEDRTEGISAFKEKRKPSFKGQ